MNNIRTNFLLLAVSILILAAAGTASAHEIETTPNYGQYPVVTVESPSHNARVGDAVTIRGKAHLADNHTAIGKVVVTINNTDFDVLNVTNGWSYTWNTTGYPNGQYSIRITAHGVNQAGKNVTGTTTILLNVNNTRTTVTELAATTGTPTQGTVWLTARLRDGNGNPLRSRNIRFFVNGSEMGNSTTDVNGIALFKFTSTFTGNYMQWPGLMVTVIITGHQVMQQLR
ncbi:Ig-like domain-containing protein [Methanothermobacter sp.]|uniref:Ig-like domain-containing protein n=1 Tax=Methanothermobacter sp. TaxID=1884223 RepID=UPI0026275D29|nr:Ig-like domain-containing protein [Methanothermobacter sp.]MDI9617654.1 Ig-like domain-containing protein [Methanothermobacter sp.]